MRDYHIIHYQFSYKKRSVPCNLGGRYHRHKYHNEEYTDALCGKEVVKGRDEFCSIAIATPDRITDGWCRTCVEEVPWTDDGRAELEAKGFFAS